MVINNNMFRNENVIKAGLLCHIKVLKTIHYYNPEIYNTKKME